MTKRRKLNSGDPRRAGGDGSAAGEFFYGASPDVGAAAVWVESHVHADGRYGLTIRTGEVVRGLSRAEAVAHAAVVLTVAQRAEYDAATLGLLVDRLGLDVATSALTLNDLRQARPPVDVAAVAPLQLTPGVSSTTRAPFIAIHLVGHVEQLGQWTVDDARRHALFLLEAAEAVELDQELYDWLTNEDGGVGVDDGRARQVVEEIANHRGAK